MSAHGYCGRTAGWFKMALGMEVGLGPVHIVLDGDTAPLSKTGAEPPPNFFSAHLFLWPNGWIHQDATWYGGRPLRDIVFDVDPATPRKRAHPRHPIFGSCLLWPNGWMDEDAAWYGSRPRPRPQCTRRGPSSRERGTSAPSLFGPCLLWPRSPISTTVELLFGFSFFIILFCLVPCGRLSWLLVSF